LYGFDSILARDRQRQTAGLTNTCNYADMLLKRKYWLNNTIKTLNDEMNSHR